MNKLEKMDMKARRGDEPRLGIEEMADLKHTIPDWEIVDYGGVPHLEKEFKFKDFAQAVAFANKIASLAEAEQHHPSLSVEWGRVKVAWWTHKEKGLTRNDFKMAARTDEVIKPESMRMAS